ncbi:MAG: FAD-binding oxidoreductase [Pirellulales bacterium]|nr:FAD-binding oxidoreductase [Pirellulales bacterium]
MSAAADRRFKMKWWGWGDEHHRFDLSHAAAGLEYLGDRLGIRELAPAFAARMEDVALPDSQASAALLAALAEIVGPENCRTDHRERLLHSAGKGYHDLVQLRRLRLPEAVDAVVYPRSEADVMAVLALAQQQQVAVVPFGGGTSVVSGLAPLRGAQRAVISLDLALLNRVLDVDLVSQTATVEAGIFGPDLEAQLRARGLMLGHYPQSFEYSTLGGWLATRSSGQNCLRYGGIEKLVECLRAVTPAGTVETLRVPRRGDGPDVTQMLVGSEGTLGVITQATVRLRLVPDERDYFMFAFKRFDAALEASRTLLQSGISPALLRISDEEETAGTLALGQSTATGIKALQRRLAKQYLQAAGFFPPNLAVLLVGLEGTRAQNRAAAKQVKRHLKTCECRSLGRAPGRRWLQTRFELPYLRDELLDNHLLIDTLETATTWSRVDGLYRAVRDALQRAADTEGEPLVVFCHASHLYADGASLYFTLLGRQKAADPIAQWRNIKRAANEAIRAQGAVISHHHGVGIEHRDYTGWGETERLMLRQLKTALDPEGIMNPEKLL